MAYAITSMLESPKVLNTKDHASNFDIFTSSSHGENSNPNQHQGSGLDKNSSFAPLDTIQNCLHDNFWVAYDALDPQKKNNYLELGIELAKAM